MGLNKVVEFSIAKSLKEKGFDIPTKKYYEYALKSKKDKEDGYSGSFGWKKDELNLQSDYFQNNSKSDFTSEMWYMCSAPTITEVIMWLYEKHGIWISVDYMDDVALFGGIVTTIKNNTQIYEKYFFLSPTEAYESGINYVLNNLI